MTTVTESEVKKARDVIEIMRQDYMGDTATRLETAAKVLNGAEIVPDPPDWTDQNAWLDMAREHVGTDSRFLLRSPADEKEWGAILKAWRRTPNESPEEALLSCIFIHHATRFVTVPT